MQGLAAGRRAAAQGFAPELHPTPDTHPNTLGYGCLPGTRHPPETKELVPPDTQYPDFSTGTDGCQTGVNFGPKRPSKGYFSLDKGKILTGQGAIFGGKFTNTNSYVS